MIVFLVVTVSAVLYDMYEKRVQQENPIVKNFNKAEPQGNYVSIVTPICEGVIMFKG